MQLRESFWVQAAPLRALWCTSAKTWTGSICSRSLLLLEEPSCSDPPALCCLAAQTGCMNYPQNTKVLSSHSFSSLPDLLSDSECMQKSRGGKSRSLFDSGKLITILSPFWRSISSSNAPLIQTSEVTVKAFPSMSYSMTGVELQAIKIPSHVPGVPVGVTQPNIILTWKQQNCLVCGRLCWLVYVICAR